MASSNPKAGTKKFQTNAPSSWSKVWQALAKSVGSKREGVGIRMALAGFLRDHGTKWGLKPDDLPEAKVIAESDGPAQLDLGGEPKKARPRAKKAKAAKAES